jgi:hypothetical protein
MLQRKDPVVANDGALQRHAHSLCRLAPATRFPHGAIGKPRSVLFSLRSKTADARCRETVRHSSIYRLATNGLTCRLAPCCNLRVASSLVRDTLGSINPQMESSGEGKTNKDRQLLFLRLIPFYCKYREQPRGKTRRRLTRQNTSIQTNMKQAALFLFLRRSQDACPRVTCSSKE